VTAHEEDVRAILTGTRVWAVVGCSPDPARDSHRIASMLQRRGYTVIPVNPLATEILGERCYPTLAAVPQPVEVVDIFRRSADAGAHVDEAIAIGAQAVWMQLGVIDEAAAERARAAGLRVVMDRCPAIELGERRPRGPGSLAGVRPGGETRGRGTKGDRCRD
jgi:uncharacterized protein